MTNFELNHIKTKKNTCFHKIPCFFCKNKLENRKISIGNKDNCQCLNINVASAHRRDAKTENERIDDGIPIFYVFPIPFSFYKAHLLGKRRTHRDCHVELFGRSCT